jgi:hypothetical protein
MHGILTPAERRQLREARSAERRSRALSLRRGGATYAAIGAALSVSLERARRIVLQAERLADHPHWTDGVARRAINFLRHQGLSTLPEIEAAQAVAKLSRSELMSFPNFGRSAYEALLGWLAVHGLRAAEPMEISNAPKCEPPRDGRGGPRTFG